MTNTQIIDITENVLCLALLVFICQFLIKRRSFGSLFVGYGVLVSGVWVYNFGPFVIHSGPIPFVTMAEVIYMFLLMGYDIYRNPGNISVAGTRQGNHLEAIEVSEEDNGDTTVGVAQEVKLLDNDETESEDSTAPLDKSHNMKEEEVKNEEVKSKSMISKASVPKSIKDKQKPQSDREYEEIYKTLKGFVQEGKSAEFMGLDEFKTKFLVEPIVLDIDGTALKEFYNIYHYNHREEEIDQSLFLKLFPQDANGTSVTLKTFQDYGKKKSKKTKELKLLKQHLDEVVNGKQPEKRTWI